MQLHRASPAAALRNRVRCFEQRKASIGGAAVVYPLAARPDMFLEFYLRQRYLVRERQSGVHDLAPCSVVVGPCTYHRVELVLCGHFDVFTIQFNASGFHRLFGAPMTELADRAYDARSVIGPCLSEIEQKLSDAASFEARVEIANDFLLRRPEADVVDVVAVVANRLFRDPTGFRVSDAARSAGLSVRQFERRFAGQVGLPPKQYASIIRIRCGAPGENDRATAPLDRDRARVRILRPDAHDTGLRTLCRRQSRGARAPDRREQPILDVMSRLYYRAPPVPR